MDHNKPFVRMQAAAAMLRYASEAQKGSVAAVPAVVDRALSDPDIRIRREGIRLLALLDTDRLLEQALAAFSEDTPDEVGRPYWAEAIATSDLAFEAYLKRAAPGGLPLLLAVAGLRQDRRLTPLLVAQLEGATKENAAAWVQALSRQADPALARRLLDQRDELAPLEESLLYILSTTFDARPGNRFEDWGAWLEGRTAEESQ